MSIQCNLKPKQFTASEAFGPQFGSVRTFMGFEPSNHPRVPKKDAEYVWDKSLLTDIALWWTFNIRPVHLFGPMGSGKSAALRNFAAALNVPFYEMSVYRGMEFESLVTRTDLVDANLLPQ
jgi:MoxR-like ATPase